MCLPNCSSACTRRDILQREHLGTILLLLLLLLVCEPAAQEGPRVRDQQAELPPVAAAPRPPLLRRRRLLLRLCQLLRLWLRLRGHRQALHNRNAAAGRSRGL